MWNICSSTTRSLCCFRQNPSLHPPANASRHFWCPAHYPLLAQLLHHQETTNSIHQHSFKLVKLPCGVSQGSVSEPVRFFLFFFTLYVQPLGQLINQDKLHNFFANDSRLYNRTNPDKIRHFLYTVSHCVADISNLMTQNKL